MTRKLIWSAMAAVAALMAAGVAFTMMPHRSRPSLASVAQSAPTSTPGAWVNVLVADHATNGALTIVIPDGAAAEMDAGNPSAVQLPPVMRLKIGDRIVIENHDSRPHLVMYAYVLPGQVNERVLSQADIEVYSAGCSVNAAASGTFMTMIVEN